MKPWVSVAQWIDSHRAAEGAGPGPSGPDRIDLVRCLPFVILNAGCLAVFWTGWSWTAVAAAAALYFARMFAVTGIYHRYFSHKAYRTSRPVQFLLALWGATAVQRGPLWWAFHHRHHHRHSDRHDDTHSPRMHGFWWSHVGWITGRRNFPTDYSKVPDLARYPELVFLNRFDLLVPVLFALAIFGSGWWLELHAPALGVTRWQMLVWGFFISTTVLFHATSSINSLAHIAGSRRFSTDDDSRNNSLLAVITLGEGWHNNHHRYQGAARQGFYWWEIDVTYYLLRALSWTGLIWGLKPVPSSVYAEAAARGPAGSQPARPPGGQA